MADLTVPAALQALIHAGNGQPLQRFAPARLSAAAELCELAIRGSAVIDGDKVVSAHLDTTGPDWVESVSESLASAVSRRSVPVAEWLRRRPSAYTEQRAAAAAAGVLTISRKKVLGLLPYSSMTVDPTVRRGVLAAIMTPKAPVDERAAALASIVAGSGLAVSTAGEI